MYEICSLLDGIMGSTPCTIYSTLYIYLPYLPPANIVEVLNLLQPLGESALLRELLLVSLPMHAGRASKAEERRGALHRRQQHQWYRR